MVMDLERIIDFNPLSAVILSNSLALKALESLHDSDIYDLVLEVSIWLTLRIGGV